MTRIAAFVLTFACLLGAGGPACAYEYVGLGTGVDPAGLRALFPTSRHEFWLRGSSSVARPGDDGGKFERWLREADGIYIIRFSSDDSRGDVTAASLSMEHGKVRRWILSFERLGVGKRPEQIEARYPGCRRILDTLIERYGKPDRFRTRTEDGMQHRPRSWSGKDGELTLDCGRFPGRRAIFAIDIEIDSNS
ncbi:MAG: hypothetical protein GC151_15325 [Betaproteobacteria bacterium]|nr:hypothetical protein [Betaproteobacteria bacterium]